MAGGKIFNDPLQGIWVQEKLTFRRYGSIRRRCLCHCGGACQKDKDGLLNQVHVFFHTVYSLQVLRHLLAWKDQVAFIFGGGPHPDRFWDGGQQTNEQTQDGGDDPGDRAHLNEPFRPWSCAEPRAGELRWVLLDEIARVHRSEDGTVSRSLEEATEREAMEMALRAAIKTADSST